MINEYLYNKSTLIQYVLYYKNKYCTPTLRKYSKYEPFVYLQSSNILVENIWEKNVERHISLQILKNISGRQTPNPKR